MDNSHSSLPAQFSIPTNINLKNANEYRISRSLDDEGGFHWNSPKTDRRNILKFDVSDPVSSPVFEDPPHRFSFSNHESSDSKTETLESGTNNSVDHNFVIRNNMGKDIEEIELYDVNQLSLEDMSQKLSEQIEKNKELQKYAKEKEEKIGTLMEENKGLKDRLGENDIPPSSLIILPETPASEESTKKDTLVLELKEELEQKENELKALEKELKNISLLKWKIMNEKLKQDVEMEVWRRKFHGLKEEQDTREGIIKKRDEEIEYLKNELISKNEANYKMALKLLDFQSKMSNLEIQLRKFPVKKIYKFYANVDVEIVLTKNPSNGMLSLDVIEKGKHFARPLKSIQITPPLETQEINRFTITYTDNTVDTFESLIASDIVKSIAEYQQIALDKG